MPMLSPPTTSGSISQPPPFCAFAASGRAATAASGASGAANSASRLATTRAAMASAAQGARAAHGRAHAAQVVAGHRLQGVAGDSRPATAPPSVQSMARSRRAQTSGRPLSGPNSSKAPGAASTRARSAWARSFSSPASTRNRSVEGSSRCPPAKRRLRALRGKRDDPHASPKATRLVPGGSAARFFTVVLDSRAAKLKKSGAARGARRSP